MNYWIFTVTQKKVNGETLTPSDILNQRLSDAFWGLGDRTPNRRSLVKGDLAVFYVGLPQMAFAAVATLATDSFSLSEEEKESYSHGTELYRSDYGVRLEDIEIWESTRIVKDLIPNLSFIVNKENWGAYFQGGVRQLSESDFRVIIDNRKPTISTLREGEDPIINESQFALEAHLEEFMDCNWNYIDFGSKLTRYQAEDQTGRQFPAGPWSIDYLCTDETSGDFVVVELKRGKSSDSTVGQVLRYIGWINENLANPGQKTRGIIVAQ